MARPSRFALLFLLVLLARAPAQSAFGGSPAGEPGLGICAMEAGGALLTGVALTAGTVFGVTAAVTGPNPSIESKFLTLSILGAAGAVVVYPLGSAAGANIVGEIQQQHGNFWSAYLGALLGLPVGYGIAVGGLTALPVSDVLKGALVVVGCLMPPIGATVGYNVGRQSGEGYGLLDRRILPPSVGVKSWTGLDGHTVVATNVRLLTVRF